MIIIYIKIVDLRCFHSNLRLFILEHSVKAVRRRFHFDILMLLIIVNHPLADLVPLILYNFAVVSVNNRYQFSVLGYMAKQRRFTNCMAKSGFADILNEASTY